MTIEYADSINRDILTLYDLIREAHSSGLSYSQLATKAGMKRWMINQICIGRNPPFPVRPDNQHTTFTRLDGNDIHADTEDDS